MGTRAGKCLFVSFTVDDLHYLTPLDKEQIQYSLDALAKTGSIVKMPNDSYNLKDERKLIQALSTLKASRAA